jgi:glutaredoxin
MTMEQSRLFRSGVVLAVSLAASAGVSAQQVFRIVGPDGRVTYADRPVPTLADKAAVPATTARPVQVPPAAAPGASFGVNLSALPYDLRQVAQRFPVTLYTSDGCTPCSAARGLLRARGVPFVEKTVGTQPDAEALERISGGRSLPFATIGSQALQGFEASEWNRYLDAAAYPAQSQLPAGYQTPPPSPLVAAVPARPSTTPAAERPAPRVQPAPVAPAANPGGIQF